MDDDPYLSIRTGAITGYLCRRVKEIKVDVTLGVGRLRAARQRSGRRPGHGVTNPVKLKRNTGNLHFSNSKQAQRGRVLRAWW